MRVVARQSDLEPLFLGIDGGGTHCRARLCDQSGAVLGSGQAGAANTTLGMDRAFQEIMNATHAAIADAGLDVACRRRIYAGLGLAGLSLRRDHRAANAHGHPFAGLRAETDAYVACLGAHQGQDGAVLIVGTGSCGLLIKDGSERTVGGWGFLVSDQGGGAQLGRKALRRALAEHDSIHPPSSLGRALMARFGDDPEAVVTWSETATPKSYGDFAPIVFDHAGDGDTAALELVGATAGDIERLILALVAKGAERVALIGGLAEPIAPWLSDRAKAHLTEAVGGPLEGSVMLARMCHEQETADA